MFLTPLVVLAGGLSIALIAVLVWGFVRTRNPGYAVLLVPFGLWHFVPYVLSAIVDSQPAINSGGDTLELVQLSSQVLRGLFILVGFYLLIRRSPIGRTAATDPSNASTKDNVGGPV